MANKALIELASKVYNKSAQREEMAEFLSVIDTLRQKGSTNPQVHWEINQIIVKTVDEVLTPRLDFLNYIAEVQRVGHGEKIEFQVPGKTKMKMEWTSRGTTVDYQRVGFKSKFTAEPEKLAGGAYYEIDQLLAGNTDAFVGVIDALVKDMEDKITGKVITTLAGAMASAPAANKWTGSNIAPANFDQVSSVIQRYDRNVSTIVDIDFAKKIAGFVGAEYLSDRMKELKNQNGYFTTVNGVDIIVFTNPYTDAANTTLAAPRKYGFIVPAGLNEKIIKVGFEGSLEQFTATDIQSERAFIKASQKCAVSVLSDLRNIGFLEDTSLA